MMCQFTIMLRVVVLWNDISLCYMIWAYKTNSFNYVQQYSSGIKGGKIEKKWYLANGV